MISDNVHHCCVVHAPVYIAIYYTQVQNHCAPVCKHVRGKHKYVTILMIHSSKICVSYQSRENQLYVMWVTKGKPAAAIHHVGHQGETSRVGHQVFQQMLDTHKNSFLMQVL